MASVILLCFDSLLRLKLSIESYKAFKKLPLGDSGRFFFYDNYNLLYFIIIILGFSCTSNKTSKTGNKMYLAIIVIVRQLMYVFVC